MRFDIQKQKKLNLKLLKFCKEGNVEQVKYLLTSSTLRVHANINCFNDSPLKYACQNGHLELVKYLLTSLELKKYANIYADNSSAIKSACRNGHLSIIHYLLTSKDLTNRVDVHSYKDAVFFTSLFSGRIEVLKYLIFDFNISLNPYIADYLNNRSNPFIEMVKKMFLIRSFNRDLEYELNSDKI
jgi:ankyrin repeat protein